MSLHQLWKIDRGDLVGQEKAHVPDEFGASVKIREIDFASFRISTVG
jgi:hypothetical protein